MEEVVIEKLVHGGQGLGELADGRKVFVWNALPGEKVRIEIIKQKRSFAEAIAVEILEPSAERMEPVEANYLATSPWQMMTFDAENTYKKAIVVELFQQAHVKIPEFSVATVPGKAAQAGELVSQLGAMENPSGVFHYRNKMEYSFWGDDDGLHLALHQRGSHGKQIVTGSLLAMPAIDTAANAVVAQLSELSARAGDLKTIIVRSDQQGNAVAALFTKLEKFRELALPPELKGLRVYYSDPKSPASVQTKFLYEVGDVTLTDELLGKTFEYDVDSFFQVNIPIFERALVRIKEFCDEPDITDMYAGVGTIGLSVASKQVQLIELDPATAKMLRRNARASGLQAEALQASAEKSLEHISADKPVIFDPPRAGLHAKVVSKVLEVLPSKIVYLSCNPATQARDLALLQEKYVVKYFETFNFFPRTPHIETLAVLELIQ